MSKYYGKRSRDDLDALSQGVLPDCPLNSTLFPIETECAALPEEHDIKDVLYIVMPYTMFKDGAKCLADLNPELGDQKRNLGVLLSWIFGSLQNLGSFGAKPAATELAKELLKGKYRIVPGKPTHQPVVENNGGNQGGFAGGKDPQLHAPQDGEDEEGGGEQQGQTNSPQALKNYLSTAYMIMPDASIAGKVSVTVVPLMKHLPEPDEPLSDAMTMGKNLVGYLITIAKRNIDDAPFSFEDLLSERIQMAKQMVNDSMIKMAHKQALSGATSMTSTVSGTDSGNFKFSGEVTSQNGLKVRATMVSARDSPTYYMGSIKRINHLVNTVYPEMVDKCVEAIRIATHKGKQMSLHTVKLASGSAEPPRKNQQRNAQELGAASAASAHGSVGNAPLLNLATLRSWPLVRNAMTKMGVDPRQLQQIFVGGQVLRHPGYELGFQVPPHMSFATLHYMFPQHAVLRLTLGTGGANVIRDLKRLQEPDMDDAGALLSEGGNIGVMPDGQQAAWYLPHEVIAVTHQAAVREAWKATRDRHPNAPRMMKEAMSKILQDNEAMMDAPNSRAITNCIQYLNSVMRKNNTFYIRHHVVEGLSHVGQMLTYLIPRLSDIGVHTNHLLVFKIWISSISLILLGYSTMSDCTPPSVMSAGPPATGKTTAIKKAIHLQVPGSVDTFTGASEASLKMASKEQDMVAQLMPESPAVFTTSKAKLSADEKAMQTIYQQIITDKFVTDTKYHEVLMPNGEVQKQNGTVTTVRRSSFFGPKNAISLPEEAKTDAMFNRLSQMLTAPLTPPLEHGAAPPLSELSSEQGIYITGVYRKLQALLCLLWTRFVESGLVPQPDLSLFYCFEKRLKESGLFMCPSDRVISSGSVVYSSLVSLGALFYFVGVGSPLTFQTPTKNLDALNASLGSGDVDSETLFNSEAMANITMLFQPEFLSAVTPWMGPNREAALFTLSQVYLWDHVVTTELVDIIGSKLHFTGALVRRCVQLRDRALVKQQVRSDTEGGDKASNLRLWCRGEDFANVLDLQKYYYANADDNSTLYFEASQSMMDKAEKDKIPPPKNSGGDPQDTEGRITRKFHILQGLKVGIDTICCLLAELCKLLTTRRPAGRKRGRNTRLDDSDSDESASDASGVSWGGLEDDADDLTRYDGSGRGSIVTMILERDRDDTDPINLAVRDIMAEVGGDVARLKEVIVKKMEKWRDLMNEKAHTVGQLVTTGVWNSLIYKVKSACSSRADAEHILENVDRHRVNVGENLDTTIAHSRLLNAAKVSSSLPATPEARLKKFTFRMTDDGRFNPNYLELQYKNNSKSNIFQVIHNLVKSRYRSRLKVLSEKEIVYFCNILMQMKITHPDVPPVAKVPSKAEELGTIFDPRQLANYELITNQVLVLESTSVDIIMKPDEGEGDSLGLGTLSLNSFGSGSAGGRRQNQPADAGSSTSASAKGKGKQQGDAASSSTSGAASSETAGGASKGEKRAWLNTHFIVHNLDTMVDKFMETVASAHTTPDIPVVLGIPYPDDVRLMYRTKTRKGSSPSEFVNPHFIPDALKTALRPMPTYIIDSNGEASVVSEPVAPILSSTSHKKIISMGEMDEERGYYEAFEKKHGINIPSDPSVTRQFYKDWLAYDFAALGLKVDYPEQFKTA